MIGGRVLDVTAVVGFSTGHSVYAEALAMTAIEENVVAEAETLRHRMVAALAERGELDQRWRAALIEVPRHVFLPEVVWRQDRDAEGDCDLVPLRRVDDPGVWLELAYANAPVTTQVDDGVPAGGGCGFEVSSSVSMPAVVAQMLGALDAEPGMRVLEIGTGTGYNAALLAHRLGAEQVVSVEVDPAVARHARCALDHAGFGAVTVVTGDGADGYEPGAPYDRVGVGHRGSRAGAARVGGADLPGGLVITPWGTPFYRGGGCSR